jgi:hypothetical protein
MSIKNSSGTIGNRNRDLPACSTVVLYMNTCIHFFYHICSFLLRIRNVSYKRCRGNQNILCSVTFNRKLCRLWDSEEIIWCTHWIPKATNRHRICNNYSFPLQQWLNVRASMLRYTYSTLPVLFLLFRRRQRRNSSLKRVPQLRGTSDSLL